ncbi:MAG: histone deacetylase [Deltaproteobacteria bacterium]|nr:histone deacetylase [Deltaproteobacteria bacterium]
MKFIFSQKYFADIGIHVFPTKKYIIVHQKLIAEGIITEQNILTPEPSSVDDLLLVHEQRYIDDLLNLRWTPSIMRSELPISQAIVDAYLLATGGTILAARKALEDGIAVNLSGGFHHAFADHAEGFCYTNDIAIAIRCLQHEGAIQKAAVVDCDVHQGNGTAYIFQNDTSVFTFSIHQEYNYPIKQRSDIDIGLDDGTDDKTYLRHIQQAMPRILNEFQPDFILYVAGADPYEEDQLGGLSLSIDGLKQRDSFIISQCMAHQVPTAIVLAGGYAFNTEDTVEIHCNTCEVALECVENQTSH